MDPYNHSTPISTKLPILDTGKFEQWKFRIQQYLQHERYAPWEVIEFGDSYKAPPEESAKDKGLAGEVSASIKKKGRTVAITTEDMQKRKNDVKARTTLLLALHDEHQLQAIISHLEFMDVPIEQDDLNQKFLTSLAPEWLAYTIVWRNRDDIDTMSLDDVYNHLNVYEPEPNGSQIKYEEISYIDGDDIEEMDIKWNLALLSMRADMFWKKTESADHQGVKTEGRERERERESYKKDPKVEEPALKAMIAIDGGSSGNVVSKPMIKFVKESGCPNATKVNNAENARKPTVKYAEIFDHLEFNCKHDIWMDKGKTWTRVNHAQDNMKYTSTHKSMTPRAVLLKFGTKPIAINRPFSTARPTLNNALPKMTSFVKTTHSNVKRPFERKSTAKNKVEVPTVRPKIPTAGSKVPAAKPTIAADKGNKGKVVKASAHWILKPKQNSSSQGSNFNGGIPQDNIDDKGYWDSGCSRHMTGNISYFFEYEPFNGGYVSFGHGRGKITDKGSIKTEKIEHNTIFHQTVDFLESSHIMYALTVRPTVYVSHIRQFWSTARVEKIDGETKILAKVNGRQRTVSESSIRRHLKLNDEEGISTLRDNELFENLSLMDNNILPNQRTVELFVSMLVPQGEGSEHPSEPRHTPSNQDEPIHHEQITQSPQHAQITSHEPITQFSQYEQTTSQGATILSQSHSLKTRVKTLEDNDKRREGFAQEDAPNTEEMDQGEDLLVGDIVKNSDKSADKGSDSTYDMANVLGTLEAVNILANRGLRLVFTTASIVVSPAIITASRSFHTAAIFTTASVATPTTRVTRSLRRVVIESSTSISINILSTTRDLEAKFAQEDQIIREQPERDSKIARIHAERELEMMIAELDRSNEIVAKYLSEYEQAEAGLSHDEKLGKESFKKLKTTKASGKEPTQEQQSKEPKELSEEEFKKMIEIVPVEELYIEALQVKYLIIDWEIYSEDQRKYWKIIRVGNHTKVYQIFDVMLKKFNREDLDRLWSLVKETCSTTEVTDEKEKELWVELKRLYKPDSRDPLWALQRYMHDPLVWRLNDTCGVHHVSSGMGYEIFMLVEKDYLLTKGLTTLMICNELQVDQYSEMANELLMKIYIIANSPR
nr:hypothetical protein [Tanacetum cinerariifolium]